MTAPKTPLLSVRDLSVALPKASDRAFAVESASFDLFAGEVLCLVGESGAGKSALTGTLLGAPSPGLTLASGSIHLKDRELTGLSPGEWRKIRGDRIALIPQEPMAALNPTIRVGKQIEEVLIIHGRAGAAERRARALELAQAMRLPDPETLLNAWPHELSGGQCQRICIGMALARHPDVLIADEPTTALDVTTQAEVLRLVRELKARGDHGILFITHDLGVVAEIADRIAVMRYGKIIELGEAQQVLKAPAHPYTRTLLAAAPRLIPASLPTHGDGPAKRYALEAARLVKMYGASKRGLDDVNLRVERGSTLSIVGESGSGKSTLAKLFVRLIQPTSGDLLVNDLDWFKLSRTQLRKERRRIQMIFQDPYGSLNPRRTAGEIIARAATLGGVARGEAKARAEELLTLVGLSPEAYHRLPKAFSGGQRQRIGIARALAMNPEILIADESVSALDVSIQAQILDLLADLKQKLNLTLLFITHDLRVAARISSHIAVMQRGKIVEFGEAEQVLNAPAHPYTRALIDAAPGRV